MLVCGNTAAMVSETRYARHFHLIGDRSRHFGRFDCGDAAAPRRRARPPRAADLVLLLLRLDRRLRFRIVERRHRFGASLQHGALIERALVGDLAGVERRRLGKQQDAFDAARRASRLAVKAASRLRNASRTFGSARSPLSASGRHASRSGKIKAVTSSRSWPAMTASLASGASAETSAARNGPTLTQVPVASLKSSAMRPSNRKPPEASPGVAKRTPSPKR